MTVIYLESCTLVPWYVKLVPDLIASHMASVTSRTVVEFPDTVTATITLPVVRNHGRFRSIFQMSQIYISEKVSYLSVINVHM